MATAPPPARYGAILKARVRASALPSSYTISGDTTAGSGIGGLIQTVADRITGGGATSEPGPTGAQVGGASELQEGERAAAELSDETALLLLRAMVTAAYSDGALSEAERARIMQEVDEGGDPEDRRTVEREIANPKPLDELLGQVRDQETAEKFYLASPAAIGGETEQNRAYLADLRQRLGLSAEDAAEIEELAS